MQLNYIKNKTLTATLTVIVLLIVLCLPALSVTAKNIGDVIAGLNQTATEAHITQDVTIFGITGKLIFLLLGILGSLFLLLVIYGGITWMTAAGNEEKIAKARSTVIHAVIGLIIVLAAYLLTNFVIFQLSDNLTTGGKTPANNQNTCQAAGGQCFYASNWGVLENLCLRERNTWSSEKNCNNPPPELQNNYRATCCIPK